jgi:DNA-directed RNA polymerase subunit RPC12/RpoP
MFDTVHIVCPHCHLTTEEQSKRGECHLYHYTPETAPISILEQLQEYPPKCIHCGETIFIQVRIPRQITIY